MIEPLEQYDAVVIGSGPNGLAAAITLARSGQRVLVLEARPIPGGAVATEELTLPGFRHDTFSAVHPAALASPVFASMPLAQHGLRWVQPPVAVAHPLSNGTAVALYRDMTQTVASLNEQHPGDGDRWQAFMQPMLDHYPALRDTILGGFPPVGGGLRVLAAFGVGGSLELARLLLLPAAALAGELFRSGGAAGWLYGSALHSDVALDGAGSAIAAIYLKLLGHAVGWGSPAGGSGSLTNALVSYLTSLGGGVRCNTPVEQVLVERGRVIGVLAAGGTAVRARLVIGDVTPHGLLQLAGAHLPPDYAAKLRRYRYGLPSLKVDWALDGPIPWTADAARQAGTVHVGGTASEMLQVDAQVRAGSIPDTPFVLLGQQSLADPTRAPAGKHTAWGYTHPPHGLDWSQHCEPYVARIEQQIERYAPGFRERILARHVMTPSDLQQRNRNLVQGDVGGGSYALDQLVFRPMPAIFPYQTPIRGLYIGSAATFPGAAVHGVGGAAAARLALLEQRIRWW